MASYPHTSLWRYGLLALPVAFAGFPLYVLAPDFYATQHGISLAQLGILLLGLRLFDAIQDPWIGIWSDKFQSQLPYVMVGAAAFLCFSLTGLFNAVFISPAIWFVLCVGVAVTAYSVMVINLAALGSRTGQGAQQHNRIATVREIFALLGLILAVSLPSLLSKMVDVSLVYQWFAIVFSGVMVISLIIFLRWYRQQSFTGSSSAQPASFGITHLLRQMPAVTRRFYITVAITMFASSMPAVLVLFFTRDLLGAANYTGVFLLLYFLSGALAMPLWQAVAKRTGEYRAWFFSMCLAVGTFVGAYFLGHGDIVGYSVICTLSGIALGADLALPPAILAQHLHAQQKLDCASSYYALLTLISKASLALASAFVLPLLEFAGFVPMSANSGAAIHALSLLYALLPCLVKLLGAYLLYIYFIQSSSGENHEIHSSTHSHRSRFYAE